MWESWPSVVAAQRGRAPLQEEETKDDGSYGCVVDVGLDCVEDVGLDCDGDCGVGFALSRGGRGFPFPRQQKRGHRYLALSVGVARRRREEVEALSKKASGEE
ncbi:hypothetical protein QG37_01114 [Candidozyma auris]|nr:hypothetical protein QG37_01114 [[Candida] auris]